MILHIDSGKEWRGGQAQVLLLMRGLAERGFAQCLICPPEGELGQRAAESGLRVENIPMAGEWDWRAPGKIAALASQNKAALLHAHASQAHGLCWRALRQLPHTPLVVTRRVDFAIGGNLLSRWKYRHARTHYIAISSGVRDALARGGVRPDHIAIVHSGIDPARWSGRFTRADLREEFALPKDAPIVVNVAALADHKGQRYLIEAAPRILHALPNARIFIVGEGELRQDLQNRIETLGLDDRVHLAGYRADVEKFLAGADLFVLPSHLEGLCTSLLDAMWFAKAAVGTRVGGVVDAIEDGRSGLLVEARNPAALAEAVIALLRDPRRREELGLRGREMVEERFTAQAMVAGTAAVYEQVLARKTLA